MKTVDQIKECRNRKKFEQEAHQRKLEIVKAKLCRGLQQSKEEVEESERYTKRMIELMSDDTDPFSYCFESGWSESNDDASLVVSILRGCNMYNQVIEKLNSKTGRFAAREAYVVMEKLVEYLLEEYEATKKSTATEHTYNSCDYHLSGNVLVFEPKEDFDVACNKKWALGVIYYYLVTGYPALDNKHKIDFYNKVGLGPKENTIARNLLMNEHHNFPTKEWRCLPKDVKKCIKGLTSYHPGNRTSTDDLCFDWCPCQESDDSDDDMLNNKNRDKLIDVFTNKNVVDRSIKVTSLKAIIEEQKNDMKALQKVRKRKCDPEHNIRKNEWTSLFTEAKTQSRKKKRTINASKKKKERGENEESERKIQQWLVLHYNRWDSKDAIEEYNKATIPFGAWGRVEGCNENNVRYID